MIPLRVLPRTLVVLACSALALPVSMLISLYTRQPVDLLPICLVVAAAFCVCIMVSTTLDWVFRRYVLTSRRAIVVRGVVHQMTADVALDRIQNVALSRPLFARIVGTGHIGIATAGTDGWEMVWTYAREPYALLEAVRKATAGDHA
jgi:uncharacterized membrane protein YdbT with pleckstrin-like domain